MLLPIVQHPDPRLRAQCATVTTFDDALRDLVASMFETLYDAGGLGLAAPQVGEARRLLVLDTWQTEDSVHDRRPLVLANPEIILRAGTQRMDEGCLSFPGVFETVERAQHIIVRGRDAHGAEVEHDLTDLAAFAMQHEIDHLDGILLIDRIITKLRER